MDKQINVKNLVAVKAALDAVQHRCSRRTLYAQDIAKLITAVEEYYNITPSRRRQLVGLSINWRPFMDAFPACYRGVPEGTEVTVELRASGWFLAACKRNKCVGSPKKRVMLTVPADRKDILLDCVHAGLSVNC